MRGRNNEVAEAVKNENSRKHHRPSKVEGRYILENLTLSFIVDY